MFPLLTSPLLPDWQGQLLPGLEWFWNNVLLPIAGWAIEEAVPTFLNMLAAAIGVLNSVIEVLQPLMLYIPVIIPRIFSHMAVPMPPLNALLKESPM